jgi:hypothetical protein
MLNLEEFINKRSIRRELKRGIGGKLHLRSEVPKRKFCDICTKKQIVSCSCKFRIAYHTARRSFYIGQANPKRLGRTT